MQINSRKLQINFIESKRKADLKSYEQMEILWVKKKEYIGINS